MARQKKNAAVPSDVQPTPAAPPDQNAINTAILQTLQGITKRLDQIESREAPRDPGNRRTQARSGQTRNATSRKAEQRVMPPMGYQSLLWVDPAEIPDDMEYTWVRTSTLGQPDDLNVLNYQKRGWRPVPRERHLGLCPPDILGRERELPTCITLPGLVLMEKPRRLVEQARAELKRMNMTRLRAGIVDKGELNEQTRAATPFEVEVDETMIESVRGQGAFQ